MLYLNIDEKVEHHCHTESEHNACIIVNSCEVVLAMDLTYAYE